MLYNCWYRSNTQQNQYSIEYGQRWLILDEGIISQYLEPVKKCLTVGGHEVRLSMQKKSFATAASSLLGVLIFKTHKPHCRSEDILGLYFIIYYAHFCWSFFLNSMMNWARGFIKMTRSTRSRTIWIQQLFKMIPSIVEINLIDFPRLLPGKTVTASKRFEVLLGTAPSVIDSRYGLQDRQISGSVKPTALRTFYQRKFENPSRIATWGNLGAISWPTPMSSISLMFRLHHLPAKNGKMKYSIQCQNWNRTPPLHPH